MSAERISRLPIVSGGFQKIPVESDGIQKNLKDSPFPIPVPDPVPSSCSCSHSYSKKEKETKKKSGAIAPCVCLSSTNPVKAQEGPQNAQERGGASDPGNYAPKAHGAILGISPLVQSTPSASGPARLRPEGAAPPVRFSRRNNLWLGRARGSAQVSGNGARCGTP